jgi:hypothetical protein
MKICPQCDTGYPDNAMTCPTHGGLQSEILDLRPGMLVRKTYRIERLLDSGYFLLAAYHRLGRRLQGTGCFYQGLRCETGKKLPAVGFDV